MFQWLYQNKERRKLKKLAYEILAYVQRDEDYEKIQRLLIEGPPKKQDQWKAETVPEWFDKWQNPEKYIKIPIKEIQGSNLWDHFDDSPEAIERDLQSKVEEFNKRHEIELSQIHQMKELGMMKYQINESTTHLHL